MDALRDNVGFCEQSLLIGASNSYLARRKLRPFNAALSLKLQPDGTCVHALSELFSNSSPHRYTAGDTLFLECFVNDVILGQNGSTQTEDQSKIFSLLCDELARTKMFRRFILLDLWPLALKTESLAPQALRISHERTQILATLNPTIICERIELGRDTSAYDNPADLLHLNQTGIEAYTDWIRTRLSPNADQVKDQLRPREASADAPWIKPAMLHCNAAKLAATLLPDHLLETHTNGLTPEVYLPVSDRIELQLPKDTKALNLLSISYRETPATSYISIKNSKNHYIFNTSCSLGKPRKRVMPIPLGQLSIHPKDPLIIESCLEIPPGAEEISNSQRLPSNAAKQSPNEYDPNRTKQDSPGIFGLTFDADASKVYAPPCRPTAPAAPHLTKPTKTRTNNIRIFPVGMWPGYQASNHGCFRDLPGINIFNAESIVDADAILVGVFTDGKGLEKQYQQLIKQTSKPLILYTNEHSSEGILPGINQLNFSQYFACISHYHVAHPAHAWSPMAVNWYGWECHQHTTNLFWESRHLKPPKTRQKQAVFCYSNDSCEYRNRTAELLLPSGTLHACGALLNNCGGKTAPREEHSYRAYCSKFKGYLAFENSSFPGYVTEKILHGLMAGCKTFYWGDATANELFSETHCINLTGLAPDDSAKVIAMHLATDHDNEGPEAPFKPHFQDRLMAARDSLCRILLSLT